MPIGSVFLLGNCWLRQHEMVQTDLCGIQKLFAIIALGSLRHRLSLDRSNGGYRLGHRRHLNLDMPCCCAICLQAAQDLCATSSCHMPVMCAAVQAAPGNNLDHTGSWCTVYRTQHQQNETSGCLKGQIGSSSLAMATATNSMHPDQFTAKAKAEAQCVQHRMEGSASGTTGPQLIRGQLREASNFYYHM